MVDEMIAESMRLSIGEVIVFWDNADRRFEGKVLAVSDEYLKFFDCFKMKERFVRLSEIKEAELV